jgi:LysM repeat protein
VVDDGETCGGIAFQYMVTEAELIRANGLAADCSDLWVGQVLRIPAPHIRLDAASAEALVSRFVFENQPGMNPAATFPLEEITPPGAWERMRAQVFKVRMGVQQFQSYGIVDGAVIPIGESFGGTGVNRMLVSDLDADGSPELLYTYGFGSGIHRSSVGMLRIVEGKTEVTTAELSYPGELTLEQPLADDPAVILTGTPDGGAPQTLGELKIASQQLVLVAPGQGPKPGG